MMTIRQWHSYMGFFIAPSVLFFALTGAAQLFSLHEDHGSYHTPAILEKLSSVHKDQVFKLGDHHETPQPEAASQTLAGGAASQAPAGGDDDKTELSTLALKVFFLLIAVCLSLSTALGLWMGLAQTRQKRLRLTLLIAGAVIPVGLLQF